MEIGDVANVTKGPIAIGNAIAQYETAMAGTMHAHMKFAEHAPTGRYEIIRALNAEEIVMSEWGVR